MARGEENMLGRHKYHNKQKAVTMPLFSKSKHSTKIGWRTDYTSTTLSDQNDLTLAPPFLMHAKTCVKSVETAGTCRNCRCSLQVTMETSNIERKVLAGRTV